jgi:competence protein ComEC
MRPTAAREQKKRGFLPGGGFMLKAMTSRSLRHRAPLLWLVLPLLAGLAAGRMGWLLWPPAELAGAAAVLAALAGFAAARAPRIWAGLLLPALVLAGGASYAVHRAHLPAWDALPPREARLTLQVARTFTPTEARRAGGTAVVAATDAHLASLLGQRVYYSLTLAPGEAAPVRGAEVAVTGVLQSLPERPGPGSFEDYLLGAGMNFELTRARVTATVRAAPAYQQFCARLLVRMEALLGVGLEAHPEQVAVYRAMMLGQKRDLSVEQHDLFMHSGTMHLFAINGLHIGVVAVSLHLLLALLRCPRAAASAVVLAALWLDVDTTGASPSAVRAFLMVAMLEVAWIVRRPSNPLAAIAAAALLTVLLDPLDFFSASFEMSYAVVTAILTFGLPLAERWQARWPAFRELPEEAWRWRHRRWAWLQRRALDLLGIGCAATLVSTFSGVEFFGVFAAGALLANLVLVPLASGVIMAGFASLVCGLAGLGWAGRVCNEMAGLLLGLIDWLIRQGARVPGAFWSAHFRPDWAGPAAMATVVAACLAGYATGWRKERGGFWPPVAVVVLGVILVVKFC